MHPAERSGPAATALVTNHDYAEFLPAALDSILAQDYHGPVDVLVVDDGSTDASADVLARYGDRVRVLRQENRGQLMALRAGLAESRGEIVALLDADDAWAPGRLAAVAAAFADGGPAWVANGLALCDAALRPTGVEVPPAGRAGWVPGDPVLFLERRAGTATSGLAFSRALADDLVRAIDGLDPALRAAVRHDADRVLLALTGALRRPGRQIPRALSLYRRHGRQQFAGDGRRLAMVDRQVEVDLLVARIMDARIGWGRVPTAVHKHRLVTAALRREGGRGRLLVGGLAAAARLAPASPSLAGRQALAVMNAWLAPRRWLDRRAGGNGA